MNKIKDIDDKFKINDHVRVQKEKKLFAKGQQRYSKGIYKIIGKEYQQFKLEKLND